MSVWPPRCWSASSRSLVGWLTAAVAATVFGSGAAPGLGEAASALARLPGHLSDPRRAFAPAARGELPGPVGFYAAATIVLAAWW